MKISEIRIDRTKNTGNYESLKLGFTAIVGDEDSSVEVTEQLRVFLDWEINREERDALRRQYQKRLTEIDAMPAETVNEKLAAEKSVAEKWLAKYDERAGQVAQFNFA